MVVLPRKETSPTSDKPLQLVGEVVSSVYHCSGQACDLLVDCPPRLIDWNLGEHERQRVGGIPSVVVSRPSQRQLCVHAETATTASTAVEDFANVGLNHDHIPPDFLPVLQNGLS